MKAAIFNIRKLTAVFTAMVMLIAAIPASAASASADSLVFGDVDGNNAIDSADALLVMRLSIGLADLTNEIALRADINGDKSVDSLDALLLLQAAIGIIRLEGGNTDNISSETNNNTITHQLKNTTKDLASRITNYEQVKAVTDFCNIEREKEGLDPLEIDAMLCACCAVRIEEIQKVFDHVRPNGDSWVTVLSEFGYYFRSCGENIAEGSIEVTTPEEVVQAWMDSPGHKANIIKPQHTRIGVAYAYVDGTYYWVQMFAGVHEDLENEKAAKLELINDINEARKEKNLSELRVDVTLEQVGETRTAELPQEYKENKAKKEQGLEIEEKENRGAEILDSFGVEWYQSSCPTAYGYQSVSEVFNHFMKEDNTVFLREDRDFTKVGIGHTFVEDDDNGHYWCIVLTDE